MEIVEVKISDQLRKWRDMLIERRGEPVEIDEDVVEPLRHLDRLQAQISAVESLRRRRVRAAQFWGRQEVARQVVAPGVPRAADKSRLAAGLPNKLKRAMTADVVEGSDHAIPVAEQ